MGKLRYAVALEVELGSHIWRGRRNRRRQNADRLGFDLATPGVVGFANFQGHMHAQNFTLPAKMQTKFQAKCPCCPGWNLSGLHGGSLQQG